jgi:hypothetical protein
MRPGPHQRSRQANILRLAALFWDAVGFCACFRPTTDLRRSSCRSRSYRCPRRSACRASTLHREPKETTPVQGRTEAVLTPTVPDGHEAATLRNGGLLGQRRRLYFGGLSPGDESHSLICEAVCSCRAFLTRASRSFPCGSFSASSLAASDC